MNAKTMKPKPEVRIGMSCARLLARSELNAALEAEARRFKTLATELKAKAFDHGGGNELDKRLIRDHEVRSETFQAASRLIH